MNLRNAFSTQNTPFSYISSPSLLFPHIWLCCANDIEMYSGQVIRERGKNTKQESPTGYLLFSLESSYNVFSQFFKASALVQHQHKNINVPTQHRVEGPLCLSIVSKLLGAL